MKWPAWDQGPKCPTGRLVEAPGLKRLCKTSFACHCEDPKLTRNLALLRQSVCRRRLGVRRLDAALSSARSAKSPSASIQFIPGKPRSAGRQGGVKPPHSKVLRAFSWFPGARLRTGMSDCPENVVRASRPRGWAFLRCAQDGLCPCAGAGRSRQPRAGRPRYVSPHAIFMVSGCPSAYGLGRLPGGLAEDWPFAGERSESALPVMSRAPRLNVRY